MSPKGTPTTTLRLNPDLKRKVQAKAAREGTTLTAIIVTALENYVNGESDE